MRHFLNVIGNVLREIVAGILWMIPGLCAGGFILGLVWGACSVIDNFGY